MALNKRVYFDDGAATSWVDHKVGRELADKLSKDYGYVIIDYNGIVRTVKNAIKSDVAHEYVIVFANDVVPYELFSDDLEPMNSLLMRFIARGGTVVWIGDIPFWSRTNRCNRVEKEEVWNRALPFTAFGVFTVISFSNIPPEVTIEVGNRRVSWISRRPVIYPPEVQAVEVKEVNNVKDAYELKGINECGNDYKYIYPIAKVITVIGNVYPAPLPSTSIELSVKYLRSGGKTSIQAFNVSILGFGGGLSFRESVQQLLQINSQVFYQEAASAWIICVGNGHFIRLFDEPWNLNIISSKDIEDRAFVINHYVEKVSRIKR